MREAPTTEYVRAVAPTCVSSGPFLFVLTGRGFGARIPPRCKARGIIEFCHSAELDLFYPHLSKEWGLGSMLSRQVRSRAFRRAHAG